MNLNDIVDTNVTTRKMRDVLKRNNVNKEVERLSKRKNANPNELGVQGRDGPSNHEDDANIDPATIADD